jgi:hypothetical protein
VVSAAGHVLTDRQVIDGCSVITVSGHGDASRQAEDRAADLALIRLYGTSGLLPAALASDGAASGPDLTLVGIADPQSQGGANAVSTAAAKLDGNLLLPAPPRGFSGAAALDSHGRFYGMVALKPPAAAAAQPEASVVAVQTIRAFLESQKLAPASGRTTAEAVRASLVRVICVRK